MKSTGLGLKVYLRFLSLSFSFSYWVTNVLLRQVQVFFEFEELSMSYLATYRDSIQSFFPFIYPLQ